MIVVGLSGYARSGKDTAAAELAKYGYERRAFADKLKQLAYDSNPWIPGGWDGTDLQTLVDTLGWDGAKEHRDVRVYLQDLGLAARNNLGPDVWIRAVERELSLYGRYVFTDVRFPNEAEWIRSRGGAVIQVIRPGVGPVNGHVSEQLPEPDECVVNDSTPKVLDLRVQWAISKAWANSAEIGG